MNLEKVLSELKFLKASTGPSLLAAAKRMNIDGLIFNQVFGCPSISKTYDTLKDKMKTELNIPSIVINFKKIGENVEQVKKSVEPFMERLKNRY
jgi:benzoyl-CoA reductase/2-hydroxyglutaryl-CoA dehydratase subunit BcrC/BadD/HgdB